MTLLTDKQGSIPRTVSIAGMPTHWASFACVVGVHLNCHASCELSFIGKHAMQFGKGPFGVGRIGFPLLPAHASALLVPFAPWCALSDVCQIVIRPILQTHFVAHLAMLKGIFAHKIKSIAICQLDSAELCKLLWRGIQFEFGRNHCFHAFYCTIYSQI